MQKEYPVKTYEIPVWFRVGSDPAADEGVFAMFRQKISEAGAEILRETRPIKRRLAYPIAKAREGVFVVFDASMPLTEVHKIREIFKHDPAVIRIGLLKKTAETQIYVKRQPARPRVETSISDEVGKDNVPPASRPPKQEIKMEELDKKLEEILQS
jgi:ribosomal protein S6